VNHDPRRNSERDVHRLPRSRRLQPANDRQIVTLSTGETIRRAVCAGQRAQYRSASHRGIELTIKSEAHSISIGFDIKPLTVPPSISRR